MQIVKCQCGCGKLFRQTRKDKRFSSKACRNAYLRAEYRKRHEEYLKILPVAKRQDALLKSMYSEDDSFAIISESHFAKHGIDTAYATKVAKSEKGMVNMIRFIDYELQRINMQSFVIKKVYL